MGYVFVAGSCYCCNKLITFHPNKVPSIRVNGKREPVCRDCIARANVERVKNGLPAFEIPAGAYEPAPEEEVNWGG